MFGTIRSCGCHTRICNGYSRLLQAKHYLTSGQSGKFLVKALKATNVPEAGARRRPSKAVKQRKHVDKAASTSDVHIVQQLEKARANFGGPNSQSKVLVYTGDGAHLGIKGTWSLTFAPDGAFREEFCSPKMTTVSGFSGKPFSQTWEVDSSSTCKQLQLDDHEVCLLTIWVRTGFWLNEKAKNQIDVWCQQADQVSRGAHNGDIDSSSPSTSGQIEDSAINLRLKNKKVTASVWLDPKLCLPHILKVFVSGKEEIFEYKQWRKSNGHWFAHKFTHITSAGQREVSSTTSTEIAKSWDPDEFSLPHIKALPLDTSYEIEEGLREDAVASQGQSVPAWYSSSGHVVVQPILDGREKVYMILDTGASGFVIEKPVADRIGMSSFGKFHCHGMMEHFPSKLRQCSTISLGPMTMKSPIFMEMPLAGIVKGGPGPVQGIIGYDLFRRAVMEIPGPSHRLADSFLIQLHNPETYQEPAASKGFWHDLQFISNLPILQCRIGVENESHDVHLMIDTGAGGVDLMFNKRATENLGIADKIKTSTSFIRGVGTSQDRQRVKNGRLPWMSISERTFTDLECLFIGDVGLDLSHYVQGILCGQLLARGPTILDFARKRIAFLENPEDLKV